MNLRKKKFTLIELIVVIGILAILASLVLPNIQGIEAEAKGVRLATDRKAIQTAVDMYNIDHTENPVLADETTGEVAEIKIGEPGIISMDKLYPKYLRDFPSTAGAKYWLDYTGKVWVSLTDAPVVTNNNGTLSWDAVEGAVEYIVYEYSDVSSRVRHNITEVARVSEPGYVGEVGKYYIVQSIDNKNNKSVLAGINYTGYPVEKNNSNAYPDSAEWTVESEFVYTEITDGIEITSYTGLAKDVVIPKEINGSPVISIGRDAFKLKGLTSVKIPDTVTSIGVYAFGFNNLITVDIPDSVTYMDSYAFAHNKLESVVIPNSITDIRSSVFMGNSLTSITIPNSVTLIGHSTFFGNDLTSITIPDSVTSISGKAFRYNNLTSVTIPSGCSYTETGDHMTFDIGVNVIQ